MPPPAKVRLVVLVVCFAVIIGASMVDGASGGDQIASIVAAVVALLTAAGLFAPTQQTRDVATVLPAIRADVTGVWGKERGSEDAYDRPMVPIDLTFARDGFAISFTDLLALQLCENQHASWTAEHYEHVAAAVFGPQTADRMLVVGGEGVGKSTFARMLTLGSARDPDALLPITVSLASWRPGGKEEFGDWLNREMAATYPAIRLLADDEPGGRAGLLLRSGRCLLVLDGLDEVPAEHAASACRQIGTFGDGRVPLVVLTRELDSGLAARLGVHGYMRLEYPERTAVLAYLEDVARRPAYRDLSAVADEIRLRPEGPLAALAGTPFGISLVLAAVADRALDADELIALSRDAGPGQLRDRVLARHLDVLLTGSGPIGSDRALSWLRFVARLVRDNDVQSIRWWRLASVVPAPAMIAMAALSAGPAYVLALTMPVGLTRGLAIGTTVGVMLGVLRGIRSRRVDACAAYPVVWTVVAALGLAAGDPRQGLVDAVEIATAVTLAVALREHMVAGSWRDAGTWARTSAVVGGIGVATAVVTEAVSTGLAFADPDRGFVALVIAAAFGVGVAAVAARLLLPAKDTIEPSPVQLRLARRDGGLTAALQAGLVSAVAIGVGGAIGGGIRYGTAYGLSLAVVFGIAAGIPAGLAGGVVRWLSLPVKDGDSTAASTLTSDKIVALGSVVLVGGAAAGGIAVLELFPDATAAIDRVATYRIEPHDGVLFGLTIGVVVACFNTAWPSFFLAHLWLAASGCLPVRVALFFRQLHVADVVRQEGPIYYFRHQLVLEHLAAPPESQPAHRVPSRI